jgi:hypothetical protein
MKMTMPTAIKIPVCSCDGGSIFDNIRLLEKYGEADNPAIGSLKGPSTKKSVT